MACKGDSGQKCGGPAALSVYGDASKAVGIKRGVDTDGKMEIEMVKDHMKRHERRGRARSVFD